MIGRILSTRKCSGALSRERGAERLTSRQKTEINVIFKYIAVTQGFPWDVRYWGDQARVQAVDNLLTAARLTNNKWNADELRAHAAAYHRCFVAGEITCPIPRIGSEYLKLVGKALKIHVRLEDELPRSATSAVAKAHTGNMGVLKERWEELEKLRKSDDRL